MPSIKVLFVILLFPLVVAFIYNQISPQGISWQLLAPRVLEKYADNDDSFTVVSVDSAFIFQMDGSAKFIDIRSKQDFELDHIPGAVNIPFRKIFSPIPDSILTSETIMVYDQEGEVRQLRTAGLELLRKSVKSVKIMEKGYIFWLEKGYPTETDDLQS